MPTVTVSGKFQVVIPKEVREAMRLKVGEKLMVWQYGGGIELVRVKTARSLRGTSPGLDTTVVRERDRVQ